LVVGLTLTVPKSINNSKTDIYNDYTIEKLDMEVFQNIQGMYDSVQEERVGDRETRRGGDEVIR